MTKKLQQPTLEEQIEESSIVDNRFSVAKARGHKYKIKYLKAGTRHKITNIVNSKGNDDKQSCMCAALIVLNGFWKIKLFYHFLWRWFYYIKEYGEEELTDILATGKKKVPMNEYYVNTILLTALRDTSMTMKKTEVATSLAAQNTEQPSK